VEPLVRAVDRAAVARADVAAVEDVLHREVDIDPASLAGDLDTVAERRDRAVGPARTAVLGDVLVQALGAVVDAIVVTPGEVSREVLGGNVVLGQRADGIRALVYETGGLGLFL